MSKEKEILSPENFIQNISIIYDKYYYLKITKVQAHLEMDILIQARDKAICKAQKENCAAVAEVTYNPGTRFIEEYHSVNEDSILNAPDAI